MENSIALNIIQIKDLKLNKEIFFVKGLLVGLNDVNESENCKTFFINFTIRDSLDDQINCIFISNIKEKLDIIHKNLESSTNTSTF